MLLVALVAWGVVVQALGVYWDDNTWNWEEQGRPTGSRMWDWHDMQIVRAAHSGWHGTQLGPLLWQGLTDPRPAPLVELSADNLAGEIALQDPLPLHFHRDTRATVQVTVTNQGGAMWPAFSDYGYLHCTLAYTWWLEGAMLGIVGGATLPHNLGPGESTPLSVHIATPPGPATYTLELVLVQMLRADRGLRGSAILRLPVQVD